MTESDLYLSDDIKYVFACYAAVFRCAEAPRFCTKKCSQKQDPVCSAVYCMLTSSS